MICVTGCKILTVDLCCNQQLELNLIMYRLKCDEIVEFVKLVKLVIHCFSFSSMLLSILEVNKSDYLKAEGCMTNLTIY